MTRGIAPDVPGPLRAAETDAGVVPGERGQPDTTDDPDDLADDLEDLDFDGQPEPVREPDGQPPTIVVFDVGEVLIDETRVWQVWADILGVSPLTFAAVLGAAIAQGEDHQVAFDHVAPNVEWRDFVDEFERRYGGFRSEDLYGDAEPCLAELRQLGFTVAVAGNQPAVRREQLTALGVPCDLITTSDELGVAKPDPGFFEAVARLTDTDSSDLLYVGDRVDNDIIPAAAVGMRTCWLKRGPWGLLQGIPDGVEPDLALDGLGELPLLLQQWRGS